MDAFPGDLPTHKIIPNRLSLNTHSLPCSSTAPTTAIRYRAFLCILHSAGNVSAILDKYTICGACGGLGTAKYLYNHMTLEKKCEGENLAKEGFLRHMVYIYSRASRA